MLTNSDGCLASLQEYINKIKAEEGDSPTLYRCTENKATIGAGINLEAQQMPQEVRDFWLKLIIKDVLGDLNRRLASYNRSDLMDNKKIALVLVDMAYQLGVNGLFKFRRMLQALVVHDYERAASELLDSKYAIQTPNRANRNAELLKKA